MTAMFTQVRGAVDKIDDSLLDKAQGVVATAGFPQEYQGTDIGVIFERLRESRDLLRRLADDGYLSSLPFGVLSSLGSFISGALSHLQPLADGNNTVDNFAAQAEALREVILRYGMDRLDGEPAADEQKKAALASLIAEARKLRRELTTTLKKSPQIEQLISRSQEVLTQIQSHQQEAAEQQETAASSAQDAREALVAATQNGEQVAAALKSVQDRRDEVIAHQSTIEDLHEKVAEIRANVIQIEQRADGTIAQNTHKTDDIISRLNEQQEATQRALEHATGVSLFHSYDQRQGQLARAKLWWLSGLVVALASVGWATYWIAAAAFPFTDAFWIKLPVGSVLVYAVIFCMNQYGRERRLEEIYAFKSKVSVSLEAYRGLIERLLTLMEGVPEGDPRATYTQFVIASVDKIFQPPSEYGRGDEGKADTVELSADMLRKIVSNALSKGG